MSTANKLFCLLLALMLAGSNMAFSAHVSSHSSSDIGICSLCIHPGSPDHAIANEPGVLFVTSLELALTPCDIQIRVLPVILHDHQARAPPTLA